MSVAPSAWSELWKLPRAVWWLAGATLINRMGAMVFPFLVLYFHKHLGLELETATGIAAFYGIGSAFAAPLGGWMADRFDAVRVLIFAMGVAGALLLAFPFFNSPVPLMALTFAMALFSDLARPSSLTALARLGGPERSRDAFTLNYLAINLGMSFGPLVGGYLAHLDYRYLFWVDGGSSLLACFLLLASGTRTPVTVHAESAKPDWNVGAPAFRMVFWMTVALWVFITFFTASPVYVVEVMHRPESLVGWIWLLNTGVIVLATVHINHWTRGKPLTMQLTAAAVLFAAGYGVLLVRSGMDGLLGCILFLTLGEMMLFTNANSYLQRMVPEHKLGRALALNSITFSVALALSTPTVGYFFTSRTPGELWACLAAAGLLAAWGFYRLPRAEAR